MKLHQLTATFGKLRQQTLELKDGLNIIEAPNESGKSTWCGFLRAMLYGIDTKERDKKGVIAEKNRYQPWDGGNMEGSAQLCWKEREITLRRTGKANSPMSQFQAVYTGTEEPVPGLTGDSAGELLTGVGREVFERSAFVGQGFMSVTGSAELERRISAIVSSGQEDVSFSETEQRLRDWKNRRQSNQKNGLIPRLEEEKSAVQATLDRLEGAGQQAAAARARICDLESEQTRLDQQLGAHHAASQAQARQRYNAAKAELDAAQAALDTLRMERSLRGTPPSEETLRGMQGELSYLNTLDSNIKQAQREAGSMEIPSMQIPHPVFQGMKPVDAWEKARTDSLAVATRDKGKGQAIALIIFFCVMAVIALVAGLLLHSLPLYLLPVVFLLCAVVYLLRLRKNKANANAILAKYGAAHSAAIEEQAKEYVQQWEHADQVRTEAAVRAVSLERLVAEREELTERLLETTRTFAPEVTDLFGVSAAISLALNRNEKEAAAQMRLGSAEKVLQAITAHGIPEDVQAPEQLPADSEQALSARLTSVRYELARQKELLARAQGEMDTLGDAAALQARARELQEHIDRRKEEYNAIAMAMDGLNEANAMLQERMSPALNQRAGELLHRLTGGKYDQVSLTREFEALASRQGDVTPRKLLTLSKGTADQLYLAVRLAVCDLVLPGEDPAPLVLDDALVNFDDERLALALDLLQELAQHRQILLFTCQSRERLYLNGSPNVHVAHLQS